MRDPREILTRPAEPGVTIPYGDLDDQIIEWFTPDVPLSSGTVVLLHGGFWRPEYDRTHLRPLCQALREEGYVAAAVEYRRGVNYQQTLGDVMKAVAGIVSEMDDGDTFTLAGHSAGGHLALWAAGQPDLVGEGALAGVVGLAAVTDLYRAYADGLDGDAAEKFLGGGPDDVADHYAEADPMGLAPGVGVRLIHGVDDDRVPVDYSRAYARRYGCEYQELQDIEHYGLIDPASGAWPAVREALTGPSRLV
ncbi:MAG TPA: alpha/beta hydrolase [Stackebrandtia sp.]|jgi:acetyl esterase/lipase|uniref:alpha/beta hydrolase family protein n=1 Tax=Stackebrandtia sp. TaxID=2023065 RepID=UPI002D6B3F95|nr:alpha/beta hydrolase [Stackebrandtia sp.]HZE41061.1 alpha/beta hydrolase [Stackebrandtia sp.]